MGIQADIKWIKSELDHVKDPDLIEAFKRMLAFRKTIEDRFFESSNDEMRSRAEASLRSIENGKVRPLKEFKEDVSAWKRKRGMK